MYKRIASCQNYEQIDDLQIELIDRFGLLPDPAKNLFALQLVKMRAQKLGITKIDANIKGGSFEFSKETRVDPLFIIGMLQSHPKMYKMEGASKFKFMIAEENPSERLNLINAMLTEFEKKVI
jgi:transcription-repair coupling factor (superfamily II helicase)